MASASNDTFFNGGLRIRQPTDGYRFSMDAVILARRTLPQPSDRILDLGTGCGIIPLIIAFLHKTGPIFGVEIQEGLAELARQNVSDNELAERIAILNRDIRTLGPKITGGPFDIVVCNPPHYDAASGRINPNSGRAIARHEIAMTLEDLTGIAARMLKQTGRLIIIYPARRLADAVIKMRAAGIEPKQLSMIHAKPGAPGMRILLEGVYKGRPGLTVTPPLILYNTDGTWSEEARSLLRA